MDNPKYSVIYCSICESDKISLDQMKCMNCGNTFTDDDIRALLDEAYEDHQKETSQSEDFEKKIIAVSRKIISVSEMNESRSLEKHINILVSELLTEVELKELSIVLFKHIAKNYKTKVQVRLMAAVENVRFSINIK